MVRPLIECIIKAVTLNVNQLIKISHFFYFFYFYFNTEFQV